MRQTLTLFLVFLVLSLNAQEITNGSFESWNTAFLFEDPTEWRTGNYEAGENLSTTKVGEAPEGSYAARMETHIAEGDTAFGFLIMGRIDETPEGGVPFTTDVRQLRCWMRYSLVEGDSAIALVSVWSSGLNVATKQWRFGGEQFDWTEMVLSLNSQVSNVDSVFVAFASSDPFFTDNMANGSWLEVDEVRLTAPSVPTPDLLPNHNFEDWTEFYAEDPDGWNTWNRWTAVFGATTVTKSSTAYSGSFSARLETMAIEGDTLPGYLTNGTIRSSVTGGVPYANIPGQLTGVYQYQPNGLDTAIVGVVFKSGGAIIGSASEEISAATFGWIEFATPCFLFDTPDTMLVVISSGNNPGSVLYLDDLDLVGGNVGISEKLSHSTAPYPNPARERLAVPEVLANDRVAILDQSGRVVRMSIAHFSGTLEVPLAGLSDGVYLLRIHSNGTERHHPFVKAE
ncbi:MAG: T9SS type A sorting domain-containing protein [Flavobacteriales bacterium]